MIKKTLTLFSALLLCSTGIKAQSCATAVDLTAYTNGSPLTQSTNEEWYRFNALYPDLFLDALITDTTFHWVDSMFVYGNSCGSLTLLGSFGRPAGGDSIGMFEVRVQGLAISSTCFIKIKLKTALTWPVNYALNLSNAASASCDYVINGDFENVGPGPCPPVNPGPLMCLSGVALIPSWQTGGNGGAGGASGPGFSGQNMIQSPACNPFHNVSGTAHSGSFMCGLSCGGFSTYDPLTGLYGPTESHTYARTTLATPLIAGQNYYVQFFYKIQALQPFLKFGDGLGLYLSAGAPTFTNVWGSPNYYCFQSISPSLTPQFQNPTGNIISNVNWLPMGGVYTPPVAGIDHVTIGNFKPAAATNFSPTPTSGASMCYIDDVSVTQLTLGIRPVPTICVGMLTQLSPTTCIPPFCTDTYTWLPATGLSNPNGLSTSASPGVTTTYTLYQTITNAIGAAITNSTTITVSVTPGFTWTAGATSQVICTNLGQSATTLTASSTYNPQYQWFPGQLLGPSQPLTIGANTTFTVEASLGICLYTKTVSITMSSVCCTSTVGAVGAANINGVDIYGPAVINQDLTIGGNNVSRFRDGEFLIAPGVRITILPGSQLELKGAHLYACSNTMWQGIDVLNGGRILSTPTLTNTTLIEDAITAINIDNVNSVPSMSLTELNQVIFNKNYVAVSINNATTNAVPNHLIANVFTSRTLTFTSTQWPKASTIAPDLRAAINPTTGLAPPYTMQNAPVSNLKNPYSTQPGQIGIRITNVGNTTGYPSFGVDVGESQVLAGSVEIFNLFDALGFGIYAENSNVNSVNNVYQNMQRYNTIAGQVGGDGIYHAATWLMNTRLDLRDPFSTVGSYAANRFWDCYKAINGYNTLQFYSTYSIYRSTQSYTTTGGIYFPGNTGIFLSSSRFEYLIQANNFNNIRNAVNIPIFAGVNNVIGLQSGIYAGVLAIADNYFGAQTSSSLAIANQYMSQGVSVSCPNNTGWQDPYGWGLVIASNNFNRVYRGVSVNGFNGLVTTVGSNSIHIINDLLAGGNQRGIQLANSLNNVRILTNTVSAAAQSNTLITLVYSSLNAGSGSPSVTCNYLDNGNKGFEFNSSNPGTVWKGNVMNNLRRGMALTSNGVIGQQGSFANPTDNQWTNFATGAEGLWVDASSNAVNSKLYLNGLGGVWFPQNYSGQFILQSYAAPGNIISTGGAYTCSAGGNPPPVFLMSPTPGNEDASEDMLYSSATNLYRFLDENPTQLDSSAQLETFYDSLAIGSIGKFKQVEEKLFAGQTAQALGINSSVSPENNVEWNYKAYYQLYDAYTSGNFSSADSSSLYDLASLCPGNEGPCVYQARALYNVIYQTVLQVTENCDNLEEQGERRFATNLPKKYAQSWGMELFPNPSHGELTIRNRIENDLLQLSVKDLSGRLLLDQLITVHNYKADVRMHLQDGVYLVSLKNSKNETSIKKLVIAN